MKQYPKDQHSSQLTDRVVAVRGDITGWSFSVDSLVSAYQAVIDIVEDNEASLMSLIFKSENGAVI